MQLYQASGNMTDQEMAEMERKRQVDDSHFYSETQFGLNLTYMLLRLEVYWDRDTATR
jgi:hypothetical protein